MPGDLDLRIQYENLLPWQGLVVAVSIVRIEDAMLSYGGRCADWLPPVFEACIKQGKCKKRTV